MSALLESDLLSPIMLKASSQLPGHFWDVFEVRHHVDGLPAGFFQQPPIGLGRNL